jgi:hypothetical protein
MSSPTQQSQEQIKQSQVTETKSQDKEVNFRLQERAMQEKYEKMLQQERAARELLEKQLQERNKVQYKEEDDDSDEPYVDHKKLKREQAKLGQQLKQETQGDIQKAVHQALSEERKNNWIKQNADFYEVLQHAEKLANRDPELAESILEMPEGFERQKLVYKNIKALNLHKPETKEPSIQDKVDANKRSPYYQPSGMGTPAYNTAGDFSSSGQKNAYQKMQELKNRLRLG